MDESFVQGLVGGVLNRHKDKVLDKDRIQTLMVEIAANIDVASQYTNVKGLAKDNPSSIEMWKGYNPNEHFNKVKDCLLYTSPSPRDLSTSRMPSSA